jgi:hypothetical protein
MSGKIRLEKLGLFYRLGKLCGSGEGKTGNVFVVTTGSKSDYAEESE